MLQADSKLEVPRWRIRTVIWGGKRAIQGMLVIQEMQAIRVIVAPQAFQAMLV
jgi:hypothetical protein